jgi:hypothetical protein
MPARKAAPAKSTRSARKKSSKSSVKTGKDESCPHCRTGAESFNYFKGAYRFDVDLARKLVSDGRQPIELEPDDVRYSVDISRIYPQHLPHVSTEYPGIIAHIWGPGKNGSWLKGHLLIDGHHRAARCLQLGISYKVHILTPKESEQVLVYGPMSRRRTKPKPPEEVKTGSAKKRRA